MTRIAIRPQGRRPGRGTFSVPRQDYTAISLLDSPLFGWCHRDIARAWDIAPATVGNILRYVREGHR
jgi:hypothetical protein